MIGERANPVYTSYAVRHRDTDQYPRLVNRVGKHVQSVRSIVCLNLIKTGLTVPVPTSLPFSSPFPFFLLLVTVSYFPTMLYLLGQVSIVAVIVYGLVRRYRGNPLPLPPGMKRMPILGNLLQLPTRAVWRTYDSWSKDLGGLSRSTTFIDTHPLVFRLGYYPR